MTRAFRLPTLTFVALLAPGLGGCWSAPENPPPTDPAGASALAAPPATAANFASSPAATAGNMTAAARAPLSAPAARAGGATRIDGSAPPPAARASLDLPSSAAAGPEAPFPDEVTNFMVDRDGCDHFRGEEPYDEERRAYLEDSIAQLCTGTDARLASLRRRYTNDQAVIVALSGYEDRIEDRSERRRPMEPDGF